MRIRQVLATAAAVAALLPLAHGSPPAAATDTPFKVPRPQLIATIKAVGVLPVQVPDATPDADAVAQRLESELLARLAPAGFAVVPPEAMKEIRARARTAIGGVYDPLTGTPNQDKVRAFREYITKEYLHEHPVDAWLAVRVVEHLARYEQGKASWDGVSDSCTGHTGFSGFMLGGGARGYTLVLSLAVQMTALDGRVLYESHGGLQVLEYVKGVAGNIELVPVDPKFIMKDPARDQRALGIALDPLVRGEQAKLTAEPAVAPAAGTPTSGSHGLSRDELLSRSRRIALAPLELGGIEKHEQMQARYAELVSSQLTRLGFEVVPADEYATRSQEEIRSIGGLHDPFTGQVDEAKRRAVLAKVARAVCEQRAVSAVVVPLILSRLASYRGELAAWDGAQEVVAPAKNALVALFSPTHYGYVRSLSLEILILDSNGESLFKEQGGIQLAEHLEGWRHVPVPEQELFADPAKDERAVKSALKKLEPQVAKPPSSH
jgi:hypothetical protein